MKTAVQQWGNSLALRIPKSFAQQANVKKGSPVTLSLEKGRLIVAPVKRRKYSLEDLVSGITPGNRHPEVDWGPPRGREVW
jgi:antitoxin MazE